MRTELVVVYRLVVITANPSTVVAPATVLKLGASVLTSASASAASDATTVASILVDAAVRATLTRLSFTPAA